MQPSVQPVYAALHGLARAKREYKKPEGGLPLVKQVEKELIRSALEVTGGNRTHAAELIGISVRNIRNKINYYELNGISTSEDLTETDAQAK